MDTTIEVPGIVPAPRVPWGIYLGLGAFTFLVTAVLAWMAVDSRNPSLWALPLVFFVMMAGGIGLILSVHVGRAGRIRLTRRKDRWSALGSRTGKLLLLTAWVLVLLMTTGFIIALPEAHPLVWLFGLFGILGIAESSLRFRVPFGWHFDEYMMMVVIPRKGPTAFTWNEVEKVELKGRVVAVTGLGETVENPGGDVASDPAVVARVIEFYRSNPRSRSELSDDRFLERLRSGRL